MMFRGGIERTGGFISDRYVFALLIVGAFAFVVRIMAALALDGLWYPHLEEYDVVARNMLAGRGFSFLHHGVVYYSYIAPLHVWLSASSYWLTGSIAGLMVLQIVVGAAQAVLTAAVARRLIGGWLAPLTTGMLVALHPGLVVYSSSRSHSLVFDACFATLAVLLTFRLADRLTTSRAVHLGLVIGLGVLSRATILLFLPVSVLWILMVTPRLLRQQVIRSGIIVCLCAAAAIAPWTIRNTLLHDQFVALRTTDGEVFWRGNNPYASGTSYVDSARTVFSTLSVADVQDLEDQPDELAQSQWFKTRARDFVRDHPDAFIRLTLRKLFYFWWYAPTTGLLYPQAWFQAYMAYYVTALLLAGGGALLIRRVGGEGVRRAMFIAVCLLVLSAFQSLFYVEGRHRWAIEPLILVFSGGGVASLLARRGRLKDMPTRIEGL
jgi:4-amino-4-deoxy-L-arabinose transferase-like glycosyltransferase